MPKCAKCKIDKPATDFTADWRKKNGLKSYCRQCCTTYKSQSVDYLAKQRAYDKRRRAEMRKSGVYKEVVRKEHLWAHYRITPERYDAILASQNGCCAICGGHDGYKRLAVDHDHNCCPGRNSCGKCVRGLLCENCNHGLGKKCTPRFLAAGSSLRGGCGSRHNRRRIPAMVSASPNGRTPVVKK